MTDERKGHLAFEYVTILLPLRFNEHAKCSQAVTHTLGVEDFANTDIVYSRCKAQGNV